MLSPSMNDLIKLTNSNYALSMAVAKRARMLREGENPKIETKKLKSVSIAIDEFYRGEYTISDM